MSRALSNRITELLVRWREGDKAANDSLIPLVYGDLRQIARRYPSASTAKNHWTTARACLFHELDRSASQ